MCSFVNNIKKIKIKAVLYVCFWGRVLSVPQHYVWDVLFSTIIASSITYYFKCKFCANNVLPMLFLSEKRQKTFWSNYKCIFWPIFSLSNLRATEIHRVVFKFHQCIQIKKNWYQDKWEFWWWYLFAIMKWSFNLYKTMLRCKIVFYLPFYFIRN